MARNKSLKHVYTTKPTTSRISPLSLHDALPIWLWRRLWLALMEAQQELGLDIPDRALAERSEEHTSELQSHSDLVCRLLLEKKKCRRSWSNRSENQLIRKKV